MKIHVSVRRSQEFPLKTALLLYGESSYNGFPYRRPFVTIHDVVHQQGEARLASGKLLTPAMLRTMVASLSLAPSVEVLPECVLARTNDLVAWWVPAAMRRMFFTDRGGDPALRELSGKTYPHPPLVFMASGKKLWVRALCQNRRPTSSTKLFAAPYWNTFEGGGVCTGTMRTPAAKSVAAMSEWEQSFFDSEFSHNVGTKSRTRYPNGTVALWMHLQGRKTFPYRYLSPVEETLESFLISNDPNQRKTI